MTTASFSVGLSMALGLGLLIGTACARRNGEGQSHPEMGWRTFVCLSISGAAAVAAGGEILVGVTALGVVVLAALFHLRTLKKKRDITTAAALVVAPLLGALALRDAAVAAWLGIIVAALLHLVVARRLRPDASNVHTKIR
jgi:hypothetical protein